MTIPDKKTLEEIRERADKKDEYCCYSREYDIPLLLDAVEELEKRCEIWRDTAQKRNSLISLQKDSYGILKKQLAEAREEIKTLKEELDFKNSKLGNFC